MYTRPSVTHFRRDGLKFCTDPKSDTAHACEPGTNSPDRTIALELFVDRHRKTPVFYEYEVRSRMSTYGEERPCLDIYYFL